MFFFGQAKQLKEEAFSLFYVLVVRRFRDQQTITFSRKPSLLVD
jgi:hypothetical protein